MCTFSRKKLMIDKCADFGTNLENIDICLFVVVVVVVSFRCFS